MFRTSLTKLCTWKDSVDRKPLILRGARQVGKTWLMRSFGESHYENCVYINFDNNTRMKELFEADLKPARIIAGLEIEVDSDISSDNTLIIFDEIQEAPKALAALKYFCEDAPEYHIIAAGSLLGVALHPGTSFPVGKVSFMDLHPMSFHEFLKAIAGEKLLKAYEERDWSLLTIFKDKLMELLKQYYYIGGMPEAVSNFQRHSSFKAVREIQNRILLAYEQDFSKHAPHDIVPRIRMLWNSIPSQLTKENKKFVYGLIKEGARAREYEMAMTWLMDCGLVHKVTRITKPSMPLKAYEDLKAFKLFILDTGLLGAMTSIDARSLLEKNRLFTEFKGAMTEQFVLQQLMTEDDLAIHYWSHDKGTAEIDFVIQKQSSIIPIEVKAEVNLMAKSLKSYRQRFAPPLSIRTSLSDFHVDSGLANIPLYALCGLEKVLTVNDG